jgi:Flp pilus assembly pilin Flp
MKLGLLPNHRCKEGGVSTLRFRLLDEDDGQDLIEYALLAAVLSIGFLLMLQAVANGVIPFFDRVISALQSA